VPASSFNSWRRPSVRIAWSFLPDLGPAAGKIDIVPRRLWLTLNGGQPRGLQSVRIKRDEDFALDTADALHLGDAAHALPAPV